MLDLASARQLFPTLERTSYFNTSAVGLGSTRLKEAYDSVTADWLERGFDFVAAEIAGETCRELVAKILCVEVDDIALIPSVSAAAGLVAAQFLNAQPGENIVIGSQEYSSNQFPWRQLSSRGYDVRQVPFRNGGLAPDDVSRQADQRTRLFAVSAIQTATGHRTDVAAMSDIAKRHGAWLFVDGSQSVGAIPVAEDAKLVDFLATADHKFLLNAARGMGYLYVKQERQKELLPLNAGWSAGGVPLESFFGPEMVLSQSASRFDNSKAWLAARGDEVCLNLLHEVGMDAVYTRNTELGEMLRGALAEQGLPSSDVPQENQSHIVGVPLQGRPPERVLGILKSHCIVASVRDGQLRVSPHFYNDADDVQKCSRAMSEAFS